MVTFILVLLWGLLGYSDIVLAQASCMVGMENGKITGLENLGPTILLSMTLLKGLSYLLGIISQKTENKWDNKVAKVFAQIVSYLGWVTGIFSLGDVPKSVKYKPNFSALLKSSKIPK